MSFLHILQLDVPVSFHNPRSHLLDVYKRVALPLPQRQKSCTNGNPELTNSSVTKSSCECNLLKLYDLFFIIFLIPSILFLFNQANFFGRVKRELVPITHIVDNTKKVKLIDKLHRGSSPEAMDECSDEYSSQVDGYIDSKQERSKRKLCAVRKK